jgi:dTDP-4-dehydrorhamnose reductase
VLDGLKPLELWAGVECSVVRIGERYVDQLTLTGHDRRPEDLRRLAGLGVRTVRYPVLWERTAPDDGPPDFRFADERLGALQARGVRPIIGLVHHGSGPRTTSLLDESFVSGLARFARAVAERFPWVTDWTPINEPLTTARFSCLYGHWYPHRRDDRAFVRALLVESRATRAAMEAVRGLVPAARLVQTEDMGRISATLRLADQARFENERRFLSLELLTGRVDRSHPLRGWLVDCGASDAELDDLVARPCAPDLVGVNYYVTSDRFLDDRVVRYPPHLRGGNGREAYADVEAVRVRGGEIAGHAAILEDVWERTRLPTAITEAHLGCATDEQLRWLAEAWQGASEARRRGVDVRAVTVWSVFGAADWDSLLTEARGRYEPGPFDIQARVRPTDLARFARDLALRGSADHPALQEPGWWRRPERILYPAPGPSDLGPREGRDQGGDVSMI